MDKECIDYIIMIANKQNEKKGYIKEKDAFKYLFFINGSLVDHVSQIGQHKVC